jgi:excisionase family DNA binding protein
MQYTSVFVILKAISLPYKKGGCMETLMDKKKVAEVFGVTVKAIDKWISEKRIPYVKLSGKCVRFIPSDIKAHLEKHRIKSEIAPKANGARSASV